MNTYFFAKKNEPNKQKKNTYKYTISLVLFFQILIIFINHKISNTETSVFLITIITVVKDTNLYN